MTITAQIADYGGEEGSLMADFTAKNQNGQNISLYNYFGKMVLINFSADWCSPCRSEASVLNDLFKAYKDRGFIIITLLISGDNSAWTHEYKLEFPLLDDRLELIYQFYKTGYVPLNLVIGRNGNILYKRDGFNRQQIEELLKKFL